MKTRQYNSAAKSEQSFDTEKVSDHLNEILIFTGFKLVPTERYGDMGIISVEGKKDLTTFSQVLITQFQEEGEKGFPFEARIIQKKRYFTLDAP